MFHENVCDQSVDAKIADKLKLHWWKATLKGITDYVQKMTFNSVADRWLDVHIYFQTMLGSSHTLQHVWR